MTSDDDRADRTATTVRVVAVSAPEGIQKYTARVACGDNAEIESVAPGVLSRFFEVAEGGVGSAFVRTRAVDMTGEARRIEEPTALFTMSFREPVVANAIRLHIETALGHDGERVSTEQFRFDIVE